MRGFEVALEGRGGDSYVVMKGRKRGKGVVSAATEVRNGSCEGSDRKKMMEFLDMPSDALVHVASFLEHRDLVSLSATCAHLSEVVNSEVVWMNLCKKWSKVVPLNDWLHRVDSAKALYRLLSNLDSVVGAWSASELAPRGGLLFVTWGNLSAVAFRIMPEWIAQGLVCMRLFEVVGERDGSTRVALLTGQGSQQEVPLPGAIVWEADDRSEFHLESFVGPESAHMPASEAHGQAESAARTLEDVAAAVNRQEQHRQARLRDHLYQHQLMRTMWLAEDAPHVALPAPNGNAGNGYEHGHPANQELRHRAAQYLLRLAMGGPSPRPEGGVLQGSVGGPVGGGHVAEGRLQRRLRKVAVPKSKYQRLSVEVAGKGRELAGLWSGVYGPHGLEILNLKYTDKGEIIAYKVLGDPNVPCGEVTFRATLGSENVEAAPDSQRLAAMTGGHSEDGEGEPPNIVTTYQGEGRVAGYNYRHPAWVSGQLLVEKSGRFAFLWKDVNFIIRFRRLSLDELVQHQQSVVKSES